MGVPCRESLKYGYNDQVLTTFKRRYPCSKFDEIVLNDKTILDFLNINVLNDKTILDFLNINVLNDKTILDFLNINVLNDKTILDFLNINKIEELIHREDLPAKYRNDLEFYLTGILYYAKPKTEKYKEIHDFTVMSLKDILSEK